MSLPIAACLVWRAARGDDAAFRALRDRLISNYEAGHFSTWPCRCDPTCEQPTAAQMDELERRLEKELAEEVVAWIGRLTEARPEK